MHEIILIYKHLENIQFLSVGLARLFYIKWLYNNPLPISPRCLYNCSLCNLALGWIFLAQGVRRGFGQLRLFALQGWGSSQSWNTKVRSIRDVTRTRTYQDCVLWRVGLQKVWQSISNRRAGCRGRRNKDREARRMRAMALGRLGRA